MSTDKNRKEPFIGDEPFIDDELKDTAEESVSQAEESHEAASGPENEVDALQRQIGDLEDQMLRLQAEMQNVRRRASVDVEKARKFALERFVKELLPVADSLEKAVESAESGAEGDALVASMREGIEMTLALYLNSLKKFGVEQVDPVGEPFDPQLHEAMSVVPVPQAEPNSVVSVIQKGYSLNARLVRPAMVVVAKAQDTPKIDEQA